MRCEISQAQEFGFFAQHHKSLREAGPELQRPERRVLLHAREHKQPETLATARNLRLPRV
jgi:hypothetical protein